MELLTKTTIDGMDGEVVVVYTGSFMFVGRLSIQNGKMVLERPVLLEKFVNPSGVPDYLLFPPVGEDIILEKIDAWSRPSQALVEAYVKITSKIQIAKSLPNNLMEGSSDA